LKLLFVFLVSLLILSGAIGSETVRADYCTGGTKGDVFCPACGGQLPCASNSGWYCVNTTADSRCTGLNSSQCAADTSTSSPVCGTQGVKCISCRWEIVVVPTNTPVPTSTPIPGNAFCGNCDNFTCALRTTTQCASLGYSTAACTGNCSAPTPTPASTNGTVQGIKVMMPANVGGAPGSTQTVSVSGSTSSNAQPYFITATAGNHTASVTVPNGGYGVGYTSCNTANNIQCAVANDPQGYHAANPIVGSSTGNIWVPSGGFNDLWWHYYPPPTGSISGPLCLNAGVAGTYTLARSAVTGGSTQAVYYAPSGTQAWTAVGATAGYSMNVTIATPGTYDIVTNVNGAYADRCTGNPAVPADWGNCGTSDIVTVPVVALPAAPASPPSLAPQTCFGSGGATGQVIVSGASATNRLYRATNAAKTTDLTYFGTASPYTDISPICGLTYYYFLRATNSCGGTADSTVVSTVIKCNPVTPLAPIAGTGQINKIIVSGLNAGDTLYRPVTPNWITGPLPNNNSYDDITNLVCATPPTTFYQYSVTRSYGSGGNICTVSSPLSNQGSCLGFLQFFSASGNVTARGTINNANANTATPPATDIGGVALGNNIVNWNVTPYKVITTMAANSTTFTSLYEHAVAKAGASLTTLAPSTTNINNLVVLSSGPAVDGAAYVDVWPASGSVTLQAAALGAVQKLVLMVHGNVTIMGNITAGGAVQGGGFVLLASGNITVSNTIGVASDPVPVGRAAELQGIYIAGGTFFDTDDGNLNQTLTLKVEGSVIGLTGVSLNRRSATASYPKDYFVFRPDFVVNLPTGLKVGNKVFQELAP